LLGLYSHIGDTNYGSTDIFINIENIDNEDRINQLVDDASIGIMKQDVGLYKWRNIICSNKKKIYLST